MGCCRVITLILKAANTSETSVNLYQNIRRNNPEDSHFYVNGHSSSINGEKYLDQLSAY
jgi:hypothetical protein